MVKPVKQIPSIVIDVKATEAVAPEELAGDREQKSK